MSIHYINQCKHGKVRDQCRCPAPNKTVHIVPCPPSCGAVPEGGSEDGRAERWNTLAVEVAQVVCDTKDPGIRGTMQDVLAMMADIEKRVPLRARTEAEPVEPLGYAGYMTTFTGIQFRHDAPTVDMVRIEDIAHALSMICHWGGHSREFFSVAQHSVLVSRICPPELAFWGLHHDDAEAYYGDMVRPLKVLLPAFKEYETRGLRVIAAKFNLPWPEPPELKLYDNRALAIESASLMSSEEALHDGRGGALDLGEFDCATIKPLTPADAEREFLARHAELCAVVPTPPEETSR